MYKNSFLTRKQTDRMWHLILARVEKAEVIPDNKVPKKLPFTIRPQLQQNPYSEHGCQTLKAEPPPPKKNPFTWKVSLRASSTVD